MGLTNNIADILSAAASSALPQQGTSPTTFGPAPLAVPPPPPRFQQPQLQVPKAGNEFSTVSGNKRATKQALFSGIAQTIKAGGDYIQAKKNRALESDITRLIGAQEGEKEAQEALKQNPNDPEAKKSLATNRAIQNDITSDPKKAKQLEKAFNIDLFGKGKNKNENAALASAMTKWQQDKAAADKTGGVQPLNPIAQRFQQSQPVRQQVDPQMMLRAQMMKAGLIPDANATLAAKTSKDVEATRAQVQREQQANDLKIAQVTAGKIGGEGTTVIDQDPTSITGIQKIQTSPDGKNTRVVKNVVVPSILPSEHEGITTLVVADPNSPTGQSIARVPNPSSTTKQIPGVGTVGAGGIVQRTGQGNQVKVGGGNGLPATPGATKSGVSTAKSLGLPAGSTIISAKALSPAQVAKYQDNVTALEGTVARLQDIRQYTGIYQSMLKAGKIKLTTGPAGQRLLGGFIPSTDEEKKAAAAWQESAEYMNSFRQSLSAMGFRNIPAYDNMLALRGQLWQDKKIMDKTLDDSIAFMNKEITSKKKLLGEMNSKDSSDAPTNPY